MIRKCLVPVALAALLLAAGRSQSSAGVNDLPGMATAAGLKEWLKLTDDQVAKIQPLITTRIDRVDSALAVMDVAEEPDVLGFVKEYGAIRKEFDAGVTRVLTPDQLAQWKSFQAELEKDLAAGGARKKLASLQPGLKLTDEQVAKLQPSMATAMEKKIDLFQKLGESGRIGARDKLKAKRTIDGINGDLEKAMSQVVSPDQLAAYKELEAQKKKKS